MKLLSILTAATFGAYAYAQNPLSEVFMPQARESDTQVRKLDNCLTELTKKMRTLLENDKIPNQKKRELLDELPQDGEVISEMLLVYEMLSLKPDVLESATGKTTKKCEQMLKDPMLKENLTEKGPRVLIPELMGDPDSFFNIDSWDIIQKKAEKMATKEEI